MANKASLQGVTSFIVFTAFILVFIFSAEKSVKPPIVSIKEQLREAYKASDEELK